MNKFGVTDKKYNELQSLMKRAELLESDIEESFVLSSGSGGQKVNKTSSCVRLLHKPTSLEIKSSESRSQALNRFFARRKLAELILEKVKGEKSKEELKAEKIRKQKSRRKRRSSSSEQ